MNFLASAVPPSEIDLPGHTSVEHLYLGTRTIVYRGVQTKSQRPVIIKTLRNPTPNLHERVQFRNQYAIAQALTNGQTTPHPGIVPPLSLESWGDRYALVMEDLGGISLEQHRQTRYMRYPDQPALSLPEVLDIALQLADILHHLAQHRVIHKDIKPANILLHPESKHVQLIDFSIASLLPKETQELQSPESLEGTLAYLAPEQTGRMNRGIDYRADFYAFGVTLYQLLSDRLPFTATDPLELVHCHIAKSPRPVHQINPEVPEMVSAIVAKLMAKNAEARYQSALGLKHDLEQCLDQWRATRGIGNFELGQGEVSDRFLIPEHLYGRDPEITQLLHAFEQVATGQTELMLVAGFSGIGKTAVIREVHKPITRQKGYFIQGKFDQFNRSIPLSAFVQAFRSLMAQLLGESDAALARWQNKILAAVGENGQVLIDVLPELSTIIGEQPPVPELEGSAAQHRFNLIFGQFVRVFTTPDHPLVIFLDDLQWADLASLNLLKLLMQESDAGYLLVLGAYRDNEVFPAHPLMLCLEDIQQQGKQLETITLAPLKQSDIQQLVADTLLCEPTVTQPLTELIYQKTRGNPFFTTQFLQGLHEDGGIVFDVNAGYWHCDLAQIRSSALTDDVVTFMVGRLQKLPEATQNILKLAACIGNRFTLQALAMVCSPSVQPSVPLSGLSKTAVVPPTQADIAADLWHVLQEGLVVPESETYKFFQGENSGFEKTEYISVGYRFLHDRVQQAAYALIPDDQKQATHYRVGTLLLQQLSEAAQENKLFEIVGQLNVGAELITDWAEKEQLAQLNLRAGHKAKTATAYGAATEYFAMGRQLLGDGGWQSSYGLTLALYEGGAEAAYLNTDFAQSEALGAIALDRANTLLDQINTYAIALQSDIAQVKFLDAIDLALTVLKQIDPTLELPDHPTPADFEQAFANTQAQLRDHSTTDLLNLPPMTDPYHLAAMPIFARVAPSVYFACPALLPFIAMKMVQLSVQVGNTESSAFAYAMYSFILCGVVDDIPLGAQFGQLALNLSETPKAKAFQARVLVLSGHFITHWHESLEKSTALLLKAYQSGLALGELESVGYAAAFYSFASLFIGKPLEPLAKELADYGEAIAQLKQDHVLPQVHLSRQTILNLLGRSDYTCDLIGTAYDERVMEPLHQQANNRTTLAFLYVARLSLCYLFHDYEKAIANGVKAADYLDGTTAMPCIVLFHFYDSLVKLLQCSTAQQHEQQHLLEQVEAHQTKMRYWADHAPMNYRHKFDLVEAERHRVLGQRLEAIERYEQAIAGAKTHQFIQDEALANERTALFYLDWGKDKIAALYMQEAYHCYSQWGAQAKLAHLEFHYPHLLKASLRPPNQPIPSIKPTHQPQPITLVRSPLVYPGNSTTTSSTTSAHQTLDLASLMKATRTLSQAINLTQAIANLMHILQENAGAQTAVLMLRHDDALVIEAMVNDGEVQSIESGAIPSSDHIPLSIVNRVYRTQSPLVFDNVSEEPTYTGDAYVQHHQPQSVLCLPLIDRGHNVGVLYLENNHCKGAFTADRVEVLTLLCAQAAITLENARLYQQAQQALHLEKELHELQRTQLHLIQSEKLYSLGQMVGGIAHEINNPVTFIQGNINHAGEYMTDVLGVLKLYQQHYPHPPTDLQAKLDAVDLSFLQTDFQHLLQSMQTGSDRIKQIVTSLRTFARLDESEFKAVDLNAGIDSTLTLLQTHLQPQSEHQPIQVIKDYGSLPLVECYAGQLNQVFMNLLRNAIDALRADQPDENPTIHISTQLDGQTIIITITDNGIGMDETTCRQIFDPFFTNKPVGQGTGLGLAIAHQIITENHHGQIKVQSEVDQGTEICVHLPV